MDITGFPEFGSEQMGSKTKAWIVLDSTPLDRWLFKQARPETGEHWAEKLAEVLARELGIPCAQVELATRLGMRGSISRTFLTENESLQHGNELMPKYLTGYDPKKEQRQTDHRIHKVLECIRQELDEPAVLQFIGYLTIDALIGNTDRHHENWAIVKTIENKLRLAPTYDHASSLGREFTNEGLRKPGNHQNVVQYLRAGRGGIYGTQGEWLSPLRLLATLEALGYAEHRRYWAQRVSETGVEKLSRHVSRIPKDWIGDLSRSFAERIIRESFAQIVEGL